LFRKGAPAVPLEIASNPAQDKIDGAIQRLINFAFLKQLELIIRSNQK
jgi:hypothetical protein